MQPIWAIVDVGSPGNRLAANHKLLAQADDRLLGGPSDDVTIIPPVFVHPSAVIEQSLIGPYTTIGPNVRVRRSIVADSIVDPGAVITDCVLRDSVIGANAVIAGAAQALIVGDDSRLTTADRQPPSISG